MNKRYIHSSCSFLNASKTNFSGIVELPADIIFPFIYLFIISGCCQFLSARRAENPCIVSATGKIGDPATKQTSKLQFRLAVVSDKFLCSFKQLKCYRYKKQCAAHTFLTSISHKILMITENDNSVDLVMKIVYKSSSNNCQQDFSM